MTSKPVRTAMPFLPLLASLVAAWAFVLGSTIPSSAQTWPADMKAIYDVNFNGFQVGTFEFQSQAESESYTLTANAQLSVLLGAFTWQGETRSFGLIVNQAPKPAAFTFDFRSNTKAGHTKMGFSDGAVTNVTHQPPAIMKSNMVPVRDYHLRNVLDPLSAIMVISRNNSAANPCDRRLPIFDGKERFDLVLSYKGQMRVAEQQPSGQPSMAYVCKVRYMPIAGHKVDADTSFMATSDAIEVALRPVPSANMLVPYQITIPTMAGYVTIVSRRADIAPSGKPQIALLH